MVTRIRLVARVGRSADPQRTFLVGSLAAHVLVLAALIIVPSLRSKPPRFDNSIIVELAAAPAPVQAAAPAPPAPAPPAPEAAEPPEGVRVEEREPPKPTPELVKPKKKETKPKPEKKPEARPAPPAPRPAAETPPAPAGGTEGAVGGPGSSVAPMEGGDVAYAWYRASVTAALYSHWQRPILTGVREELQVRITFEILRDGQVTNVRIDQTSGVPSLDRSAVRAVSEAAPLPPLPVNWSEASLPAAFVFRLYPEEF